MSRKTLKLTIATSMAALLVTFLLATLYKVEFNVKGHFEGLYLLHDHKTNRYELTDHLFVGEGQNLVYGTTIRTEWFRFIAGILPSHNESTPHLHVEWNPKDGSGHVNNYLADGTSLVTYFGRYLDNDNEVHGLFVGGGMPETVEHSVNYNMNNSGMTYYNGKFWYHIWCSVNEGIDFAEPGDALTPSKWKFLGSRVVERSPARVVIVSSHEAAEGASLVRIDRRASFTAGEPYFNLEIRITNPGKVPEYFHYTYGDEPWVGYYGTSLGDVGWVKDRLITREEIIDSRKYSYAGMADIGNREIGEQPVYSNLANFIEWFGDEVPQVYFSNNTESPDMHPKGLLESNERFIGLRWDRALFPGNTTTIRLAIGMAVFNPKTGLPIKPQTTWK